MNKYNFRDILNKEIFIEENRYLIFEKIEIPMIQRDYAQGRKNETEIRKRFLEAIFDSLKNNKELEMDFVYGSISESNKIFIPLDGQQRLTTLFLLHWYIGSRELTGNEIEYNNLMELLKKFTYKTRVSSRDFCEKLVKTQLIFEKEPKEEITNLSWFFKSYKKDPTVSSMLNMLDAIHVKYSEIGRTDLFEKLNKLQFYILPLNGFNLTEELYVKMNSRGKQLTGFENFKADVTKWMKDEKNKYNEYYQKTLSFECREMPYYLSFSQKMDNKWTNFFWNITRFYNIEEKDKKRNLLYPEGKIVDILFLRVLFRYFLNKYIFHSNTDSKIIDKNDDYQLLYKEEKYMNFTLFEEILSHENVLSAFEKCFDSICQNWDKIFNSIQPSWELSNPWTFYDKLFTQSDRIIFLGMTLFLEKNDFEETKFKQWMRVVWNLVENTDIADTSSMVGVMKLIVELSINSNNIYEFLADNINQINSSSSKNAVGEERIKSGFIKSDPKWEYLFINVEKHSFFRGSIGFIITDSMEINEFTHRVDMAFKVFDNNGVNNEYQKAGHIFLRALISRYTDNSLIGQNFTDTDESEHYLKKMLSSNEIVRSATIEWFSLTDENELKKKLNEEVSKDSHIPGWLVNNDREKNRIRSAHEALYKKPDLQIWMQQKKAIRFAWNYSHLWVSKPRSWYKWVMIDSFRNEIINKLINIKGFTTDNSCKYNINDKEFQIPYYWGIYNIEVIRDEVKLIFDKEDSVTIYRIKNEQWTEIKKIDLDKCITKITIKNNNNNDL